MTAPAIAPGEPRHRGLEELRPERGVAELADAARTWCRRLEKTPTTALEGESSKAKSFVMHTGIHSSSGAHGVGLRVRRSAPITLLVVGLLQVGDACHAPKPPLWPGDVTNPVTHLIESHDHIRELVAKCGWEPLDQFRGDVLPGTIVAKGQRGWMRAGELPVAFTRTPTVVGSKVESQERERASLGLLSSLPGGSEFVAGLQGTSTTTYSFDFGEAEIATTTIAELQRQIEFALPEEVNYIAEGAKVVLDSLVLRSLTVTFDSSFTSSAVLAASIPVGLAKGDVSLTPDGKHQLIITVTDPVVVGVQTAYISAEHSRRTEQLRQIYEKVATLLLGADPVVGAGLLPVGSNSPLTQDVDRIKQARELIDEALLIQANDWRADYYEALCLRAEGLKLLRTSTDSPGQKVTLNQQALAKYRAAINRIQLAVERFANPALLGRLGELLSDAAELPVRGTPRQAWRHLAVDALERAVERYPTWANYQNLAKVYACLRQPAEALKFTRIALQYQISLEPRLGEIIALAELDRAEEAEQALDLVTDQLRDSEYAPFEDVLRARIAMSTGKFTDVLKFCDKCAAQGLSLPDLHWYRAVALMRCGSTSEARSALQLALDFDPEDPAYRGTQQQLEANLGG